MVDGNVSIMLMPGKKIVVLGILILLIIPVSLLAVNLPQIFTKKPPKDFWTNPIAKLKGGNPYALSLALSGTGLMVVAQFYSVVKRAGRLWMKRLGGPRAWLIIHEILDVVGPILILVHAGLLSKPNFINLSWLAKSLQNSVAGIPAMLAPFLIASGLFGRHLYRRLPVMQRQFRHWRTVHIALTAIFYVAGLTHVLVNTKVFQTLLSLPKD
ncbi:hypothetical protein HRbin03_00248 [archaeon HR03]|uniref:Ferric oxidoreductase domain-containing protein n=1 Tax=uncultured crenarchaeote TaxID=29281 RepID=H5SNS1_9CREN|nr:hypothetical protein HGMM_F52D10C37 [uncultured crenarchaeote]GBC72419.1 hypothetical protein HRbin03_00248 [archaeon HR03]